MNTLPGLFLMLRVQGFIKFALHFFFKESLIQPDVLKKP